MWLFVVRLWITAIGKYCIYVRALVCQMNTYERMTELKASLFIEMLKRNRDIFTECVMLYYIMIFKNLL